jgi:hypothetical protein
MSTETTKSGNLQLVISMDSKQFSQACDEAKQALEVLQTAVLRVQIAADEMFRSIRINKPAGTTTP